MMVDIVQKDDDEFMRLFLIGFMFWKPDGSIVTCTFIVGQRVDYI